MSGVSPKGSFPPWLSYVSGVSDADIAARRAALWVDRPDLGTLLVTGADRLSWLHGILTSDVEKLASGQGSWSLVLTKQGKILADVAVVAGPEETYLGLPSGSVRRVADWLGQFLVMEDVELTDGSVRYAWAMLHGPRALEIAKRASVDVPGSVCAAIDFTGLGGAAVVSERPNLSKLQSLASACDGVKVATGDDWRRLRVERLLPEYGTDIDEQRSPHEASLERRAVSWTKGCYLGQEAVCMQDMRGKVKRRLATVLVSSGEAPATGTPVTRRDGTPAGETRSSSISEILGGPVALAMLSAEASAPGTALVVGGVAASVVEPK